MRTIHTHCSTRLGDNIAHLHLVRKLAVENADTQFRHSVDRRYIGDPVQLCEIVEDLPNIEIGETVEPGSIEVWKGHGGKWYGHPKKGDWCAFMLEHHADIAKAMGFESPFTEGQDLRLDYPKLKAPEADPFDCLVINSPPMSGQLGQYNPGAFDALIKRLADKHSVVTTHPCAVPVDCTQEHNLTITEIGRLSQVCKLIVMVSTGPSWPTFNVWNVDSVNLRVVLVDSEDLRGLGGNTIQARSADEARAVLKAHGHL